MNPYLQALHHPSGILLSRTECALIQCLFCIKEQFSSSLIINADSKNSGNKEKRSLVSMCLAMAREEKTLLSGTTSLSGNIIISEL